MPQLLPTGSTTKVTGSSILTIYASTSEFSDADGAHTPSSTKEEEFDDSLHHTSHLFMRRVQPSDTNADGIDAVQPEVKTIAEYVVENIDKEVILILKQYKLNLKKAHGRGGRNPILLTLRDQSGRIICTTDGKEATCETHVVFKSENEVVRGKLGSNGLRSYLVKDFLRGNHYEITLPLWVTFCPCFMNWFPPILKCKQLLPKSANVVENGKKISEALVAEIAKCKWSGTPYENQAVLGVHFLKRDEDADTKLFVFSASLVMFHLYYRRAGRQARCLMVYNVIIICALFIGLIVFCVLYIMPRDA